MPTNRVSVTNQVQFQTALNNAAVQPISYIDIEVDKILLTSPLILPQTLGSPGNQLIINGAGCTLEATVAGAITHLMKVDTPGSQITANNMLANRFIIRDLTFNGRNANTIGLELHATSGSEVHDCRFVGCSTSFTAQYSPGTRVTNCFSSNAAGIGFEFTKGNYPGQLQSKFLGSPNSRLEQCRVHHPASSYAAVNIIASGNVVLDQVTSDKGSPQYHIYFDSNSYDGANTVVMNNLQLYTAATTAGIKLKLYDGYAKINNLIHYSDQILIDAESQFDYPKVYVEYMPNITSGTIFKTGGQCGASDVIWSFYETQIGEDIFSPTRWDGNNVPVYRYSEYFNNSKGIVTNYMKVNNNVISS